MALPALPPTPIASDATLPAALTKLLEEHRALVASDPRSAAAHGDLGLAYEANELWPEARLSLRNAAVLDPSDPLWRYHLALCSHRLSDTELAVELLRGVTRDAPNLAPPWYLLGGLLLQAEQLVGARECFERTVALTPERSEGRVGLAEVALLEGLPADAIPLAQRALALEPRSDRAHYVLAAAYRAVGRTAEAAQLLESQPPKDDTDLVPTLPDPLAQRLAALVATADGHARAAAALRAAGDPAAAVRRLETALGAHSDHPKLLSALGEAWLSQGQPQRALGPLQRAVAIEPRRLAIHYNLAECLQLLGRLEESLTHATAAVELAPYFVKARLKRAELLLALGRPEPAIADLIAAAAADPRDPIPHLALGQTYQGMNRLPDSLAALRRAAQLDPSSAPIQLALAQVALQLDDVALAGIALDALRQIAPGHPALPEGERLLRSRLNR